MAGQELNFTIPKTAGGLHGLDTSAGKITFVLGANGTGKSSLLGHLFGKNMPFSTLMSAHRQNWFGSGAGSLSPDQRLSMAKSVASFDGSWRARFADDYSSNRAAMYTYDLIAAENARARELADLLSIGNVDEARRRSLNKSPLSTLNDLLRLANIPIKLEIAAGGEIMARRKDEDAFPIAQLSDGERNALLLAASVLTAGRNRKLLIDEPERHLHRSIIVPLLSNLFLQRPDCSFIISTHDLEIAAATPSAEAILVRDCKFENGTAKTWEFDCVPVANLDEDIRMDILGGRRKVVFIEGNENSLDEAIYKLLFPNVSIVPKGSCKAVMQSVAGLRGAGHLHWMDAFGIIDNDGRTQEEINDFLTANIFPLTVNAVESIFYSPEMQRHCAIKHNASTGDDVEAQLENARNFLLRDVRPHRDRLCSLLVTKIIRNKLIEQCPTEQQVQTGQEIEIPLGVPAKLQTEKDIFDRLIREENCSEIIRRYAIKKTPALRSIVGALGFTGTDQYERTVTNAIINGDQAAIEIARAAFGTIFQAIYPPAP